jgi:hypothetical protein
MAANFAITASDLEQLCAFNLFPVPDDRWIFFGMRGLTPADPTDHTFRASQSVRIATVDYVHPRCTIGQWDRVNGQLALYPGSTVPAMHLFKPKIVDNGRGANQLMTGYYRKGYKQGVHRANTETGHEAFRQQGTVPHRRTADDADYDEDDRVEIGSPMDNLHAAWVDSVGSAKYSSLGCQVVVGKPDSRRHPGDTGPWKVFKQRAYELDQSQFPYLLMRGRDIERVAQGMTAEDLTRLRFGSEGHLVERVQEALATFGHHTGADGKFGKETLGCLLAFQEAEVGPRSDDGIVGSKTAEALGILHEWPGKRAGRRPRRSDGANRSAARDWPSVSIEERQVYVMDLLVDQHGLTPEAAAGVVGNLEVESGIIPNRLERSTSSEPMSAPDIHGNKRHWSAEEIMNRIPGKTGPGFAGVGLAQWTADSRRKALFKHKLGDIGPGIAVLFDMDVQVDFLVKELDTRKGSLGPKFRTKSTSVDEAAADFVYEFERPASVLKKIDGVWHRRERDDPQVIATFKKRQEPAHRALAAFTAARS